MITTRATAIVLLSWLAFADRAVLALQDQPAGATGRLLEIHAVAVDRAGNPVADLRPGDLEVWIGQYRVPIESLVVPAARTSEGPGRLIVLLLDDITLEPLMVARARDAANRFADRMQPNDRVGVVRLNDSRMELTSSPAQVRAQVDRFRQSLGVIPTDQLGAQLLTTVAGVARAIVEAPEPRKIIVGIGSAWLLNTPVPPAEIGRGLDIRQEWFDAMRALGNAGATYYVIDPAGVGASRQSASYGLAREAGGVAFVNTNDLAGAVDKVLREVDNYYVIRVGDPPVGRKAIVRELDVKSLRRDVTVRTRRGIPGGGGE